MEIKSLKIKNITEDLATIFSNQQKEHIREAVHHALFLYLVQEKKYFESISNPEA